MNRCLAEATPSVVALALIAGSLSRVLPGMPLHADPLIGTAADWRAYHGSPDQAHYSRLAQIDRDNVGQLEVAWTFDTGDAFPGSQMQCNPLVVDGAPLALRSARHIRPSIRRF